MPVFTSEKPFSAIRAQDDMCLAESAEALRHAAAKHEKAAQEGGFAKISGRLVRDTIG